MPVIERYFSDDKDLKRISTDFRNLIGTIRKYGELSMQLRKNYFNIYYRGNSLAKITPLPRNEYRIEVHCKFVSESVEASWSEWPKTHARDYRRWVVRGPEVRRFLTTSVTNRLKVEIAEVNNGEEITFEQTLMTDNPPSPQLVIIDRQVTDPKLKKQMDILGLYRPSGHGAFRFLVIEVKLGNNPELRSKVAGQLERYVNHIRKHMDDYIICYRENYQQKYRLGLLDPAQADPTVEIEPLVEGLVVVGGYTAHADEAVEKLKCNNSELPVKIIRNSLVSESGQIETI
jgi:hypothetical protein